MQKGKDRGMVQLEGLKLTVSDREAGGGRRWGFTISCQTDWVRTEAFRQSFQYCGVFMVAAVTVALALAAGFLGFVFLGA